MTLPGAGSLSGPSPVIWISVKSFRERWKGSRKVIREHSRKWVYTATAPISQATHVHECPSSAARGHLDKAAPRHSWLLSRPRSQDTGTPWNRKKSHWELKEGNLGQVLAINGACSFGDSCLTWAGEFLSPHLGDKWTWKSLGLPWIPRREHHCRPWHETRGHWVGQEGN